MATGFVYLFSSDHGFYKIGQSVDPEGRLQAFSSLPFNVRLIHKTFTQDMDYAETFLHHKFAAKRIKGEWFQLTEADVQDIMSINAFNKPSSGPFNSIIISIQLTQDESDAYDQKAIAAGKTVQEWIKDRCAYRQLPLIT